MPRDAFICPHCGTSTDAPTRAMPGSGWMTLALTVCFVVPGALYWVWRHTSKRTLCPACAQSGIIPTSSPFGFALIEKADLHRRDASVAGLAPDSRLERIEQAVDAIAVEVERLAESQRYATKVLSQGK